MYIILIYTAIILIIAVEINTVFYMFANLNENEEYKY